MIKLDYLFSDEKIVGSEHGLNITQEFLDYKDVIAGIVEGLYNKKDILSFLGKYEWIVKLYPGVLVPFANLIQMTIHKSYYPIDTLWYGHHEISNKFDNLFKNYIVFIDEFDAIFGANGR